ncbi:MAG: MFS transporter [Egibacteraceae bacterium]
MSAAAEELPAATRRREQRGWYVYDWANSAFQTTVITVFLGPYLTSLALAAAGSSGFVRPLGIPVRAGAFYPYLVSFSALLQVVAMPIVGAITDRTGRRRLLLGLLAGTGSVATLCLWFVRGQAYLAGGALFLVASVAFSCSIVVYNAWLPDIATVEERDAVSSQGWALGYLGGGLLLALNLALFTLADTGGVAVSTADAVRLSMVSAGAWWALFTVVPLAILRRPIRPVVEDDGGRVLSSGFRQLGRTFRRLRAAPATLSFLAAYLLYNDGIQTVISQAAVYAQAELLLGQSVTAAAILLVQFVAVVGALALGRIAQRVGAKRTVLGSLIIWIVVLAAAYVLPARAPAPFFALAAGIGLVLGGSQALSRSLFSHMVPDGAEAEYFSAYEISDRGTSWLGTLLFGLAIQITGSYRIAILSLLVFFVAGFLLLARSDIRRAAEEAGNSAPARL